MKRNAALIATVAGAVLAIGAGVGVAFAVGQPQADPTPSSSISDASTAVVSPLPTAEAPAAQPTGTAPYLDYVRSHLQSDTGIRNATDEQLIAAGHEACRQLDAGVHLQDVRVVQGEKPSRSGYYMDSSAIMNGAVSFICRNHMHDVG